jgi:hypothetical protein
VSNDDWLDTDERVPALPIPVELPADPGARVALAEQCWAALSDKQRIALTAFRENRLSARKMERDTGINRRTHRGWVQGNRNYATIVRLWLGVAGSEALDKDRLLARQDDIVETLLTPKPVFHQGAPAIGLDGKPYEVVDASAASRANETLMKAAGLLKDKELEVNVGVVVGPPTLNIQVMPTAPSKMAVNESVAIDAKFTEVPSDDDEWLGA